ncbi:7TM diverse intracellular signaling domain-containing protein [Spirochaetia bacterium 38H-sp]|uniref:7TM diverse intracellular signaling domain-containing protein n=1 Tax=Rarispira pelagica TaxID=3141764 RepID=A0ABU9UCT2_9SPIR
MNHKKSLLAYILWLILLIPIHAQDIYISPQELIKGTDLYPVCDFYWGKLLESTDGVTPTLSGIKPDMWVHYTNPDTGNPFPAQGVASYVFKIKLQTFPVSKPLAIRIKNASSAVRIIAGGHTILEIGHISNNLTMLRESMQTTMGGFYPPAKEFYLIVQIANKTDFSGGIRTLPHIGYLSTISRKHIINLVLDTLVMASIMVIALYHLILFSARKEARDYGFLFFALFSFAIGLRAGLTESRVLHMLLPYVSIAILIKIEIAAVYLAAGSIVVFFHFLFPSEEYRTFSKLTYGVNTLSILLTIVLPVKSLAYYHFIYLVYLAFTALILLIWLGRALKNKRESSLLFTVAFAILALGVINDSLFNGLGIGTGFISQYTLAIFLLFQALIQARRYSSMYISIKENAERTENLARVYRAFVPFELLKLLGVEKPEELEGNEYEKKDIAVLSVSLIPIVGASEEIEPEDMQSFLNSYIRHLIPVVHRHRGLIRGFSGERMLILFPDNHEDAILCAEELYYTIKEYNQGRKRAGYQSAHLIIGGAAGEATFTIVGDNTHMEVTGVGRVFPDAMIVEEIAPVLGSCALISQNLFPAVARLEKNNVRFVGRYKKDNKVISLFEIITEEDSAKLSLISEFERALYYYFSGELDKAEDGFSLLLARNPDDKAAAFYLGRILKLIGKRKDSMELTPYPELQ